MELTWTIFDSVDDPVTGGSAFTSIKIRRISDGFLLDWDDLIFKSSEWTTLSSMFSEVDAVNLTGTYKKDVVITEWADGEYQVLTRFIGSVKRNGSLGFFVKDGKVINEYVTEKVDATISSRATPSDIATVEDIEAQLNSSHGSGNWDSAVVLPVMQGGVYSAVAVENKTVRIVRGDTPRIVFDLGANYTGWDAYFGAKEQRPDSVYTVSPIQCTWSDALLGQGYVDLTALNTQTAGRFYGEIEIRNGSQRLTPIQYILEIIEDVIK